MSDFNYTPTSSLKEFELTDFTDTFTNLKNYVNGLRSDIDSNDNDISDLQNDISKISNNFENLNRSIIKTLSYDNYYVIDGRPSGAGQGDYPSKIILTFKDSLFYRFEIQRDDFSTVPLFLLKRNFDFSNSFPAYSYSVTTGKSGYFIPGLLYDSYWGYIYDIKLEDVGVMDYTSTGTLAGVRQLDSYPRLYYIDFSNVIDSPLASSSDFNNSDLSAFEEINPWMTWTRKQAIARLIDIKVNNIQASEISGNLNGISMYATNLGDASNYYSYTNLSNILSNKASKSNSFLFENTLEIRYYPSVANPYAVQYTNASNTFPIKVVFENYNAFTFWKSGQTFQFESTLDSAFKTNPIYPFMIGYTNDTTGSTYDGAAGHTVSYHKVFRSF